MSTMRNLYGHPNEYRELIASETIALRSTERKLLIAKPLALLRLPCFVEWRDELLDTCSALRYAIEEHVDCLRKSSRYHMEHE